MHAQLISLLALGLGLIAGGGFVAIVARMQIRSAREQATAEPRSELAALRARFEAYKEQAAVVRESERTEARRALAAERARYESLLDAERRQSSEKLSLIRDAKEQMTDRFKALADEILQIESARFTEKNVENLSRLLDPLRTKLGDFESTIRRYHSEQGEGRVRLQEQVEQLAKLNETLSEDAQNLAQALKGSSQQQGAWGEMILEKILEEAGLEEGRHFDTQVSFETDEGAVARPDVVVRLPKGRDLVVDSKVSLTAYAGYVEADTEEAQRAALRQHVESVRRHIATLARKGYADLPGVRTLDFVVMFIPVEPAFMLAAGRDEDLFREAWRRRVLLVGPSTLIFVLKTVAHLWQQEEQSRNAREIAKRGAQLYDKLRLVVESWDEVGRRLAQAHEAWSEAKGRLATGRGNAIYLAAELQSLGVQPPHGPIDDELAQQGAESHQLSVTAPPEPSDSASPRPDGLMRVVSDQGSTEPAVHRPDGRGSPR